MDELVNRLRGSAWSDIDDCLMVDAADRIEALESELAEAKRERDELHKVLYGIQGAVSVKGVAEEAAEFRRDWSCERAHADRLSTVLRRLCEAAEETLSIASRNEGGDYEHRIRAAVDEAKKEIGE